MKWDGVISANSAIALGVQSAVRPSDVHVAGADTLGIPIGSVLIGVLLLLVVIACLYTALKIYVAMRGGKIARGWFWLVSGFGLLGFAQLLLVTSQMGVAPISVTWVDALRVVALVFVLLGVGRIRKLLV